MTDKKFTDDEVIKALECCNDNFQKGCDDCIFDGASCDDEPSCVDKLNEATRALINRQKAEIAALTSAVDNSTKEFLKLHDTYQDQKAEIERFADIGKMYSEIKAEAIKEFAERLKSELEAMQRVSDGKVVFSVSVERIESVVKERLEGG